MNKATMITTAQVGKPVSRYDGVAKVTGKVRYAADYAASDMAQAVVVSASIARGHITHLDVVAACEVPGVLNVYSHLECPDVSTRDSSYQDQASPPGVPFRPFRDTRIHFDGQPIALVVAVDLETARYAASLIKTRYAVDQPSASFAAGGETPYAPPKKRFGVKGQPKARGNVKAALSDAHVQAHGTYETPPTYHHPMEMHATTAIWASDTSVHVHDKTQGAQNSQKYVAAIFSYSKNDVVVEAPFVGGAFGSGLRPQYQLFLAVLAARDLRRSVQLMLTREQMFSMNHRPETRQIVKMGAEPSGKLCAIQHDAVAATSHYEDYQEDVVNWAEVLYHSSNVAFDYKLVKRDIATPGDLRAPGGGLGMFALESTIDELAKAAHLDPLSFRQQNIAIRDQAEDRPFSTRELDRCLAEGANAFGWGDASLPASNTGQVKRGSGLATGIWEAMVVPTNALARWHPNGQIEIETAMADIGTGTYTICQQVAADVLSVPLDRVSVKLGDSRLPTAPIEGGSFGAASVTAAVEAACKALKVKLVKAGIDSAHSALNQTQNAPVEAEGGSDPYYFNTAKSLLGFKSASSFAHSAVFAEVAVDIDLAAVHVERIVIAVDAGRILNPKTARSQIIGGVIWGMSMALHEEAVHDEDTGRLATRSLADYHFPAAADIPDIEVIFIEQPDTYLNPLGVKGLGEIGLVGTAAAIANAIHDAVGVRMRKLPITPDRLFEALVPLRATSPHTTASGAT
jgi:xanthine dehydrogenase YagR molybdenum-binding subunit